MTDFVTRPVKVLFVLVVAAWGLIVADRGAHAATVSIDLCAVSGTATVTGAMTVPVWSFAQPTTPGDCTTATATLPSATLTVNEGDVVSIRVINALPGSHTVALEIPGIDLGPGAADAGPGGSVTRTFTATNPGTYEYQSSGDSGRQEAMGLAGALVVRAATPTQAYDDPSTAFTKEAVLVLSAVDPAFNAAPDTFDLTTYSAKYWLISGKAYPDTQAITAAAGDRLLLRYVNVGYDNTSMLLLGMHETVVGRSAVALKNPFAADAETIPAGSTEDAIAVIPAGAAPTTQGFPLYNRQLHLSNGDQTGPDVLPATGGGMLTFIHP